MTARLAVASLLVACACDPSPGAEACFGVCGEGTRCVASECVVAEPEPPEAEPEAPTKKKRRRRRGRRKRGADAEPGFEPEDDSHVPGFDPDADKTLDMKAGTERLSDREIRAHLSRLEPKFNRCIATSALAHEDALKGELDFVLSIQPSGKVGGVTVKASGNLGTAGVVPCARKVVYGHRFPSFDGNPMGVDYSFKVD